VSPVSQGRLHPATTPPVQRPRARASTITSGWTISAALAGSGSARQPGYPVMEQVRSGAPRRVLEDFPSASWPVQAVHHEGRRAKQQVRAFGDRVVERLRRDPGP
jgi:DNA-binding transcriptional LysR family regulator